MRKKNLKKKIFENTLKITFFKEKNVDFDLKDIQEFNDFEICFLSNLLVFF